MNDEYRRNVSLQRVNLSGSVDLVFSPAREYPLCLWCKHNRNFPDRCNKFDVLLFGVDQASEYCSAWERNDDEQQEP